MTVLVVALPLVVFAVLRAMGASVPALLAGVQIAVLVSCALTASRGMRTGAAASFDRRVVTFSAAVWRWIDARTIDGVLAGLTAVVRAWGAMLRRAQTGSVRTYAASVLAGIVLLLGYYLWR